MDPLIAGQVTLLSIAAIYLIVKIARLPAKPRNLIIGILAVSFIAIFIMAFYFPDTLVKITEMFS